MKTESLSARKKGKRQYLDNQHTVEMLRSLNEYFLMKVEVPRVRYGNSQEIETLISEEALLFAQYLGNEKQTWIPRTPLLTSLSAIDRSSFSPVYGIGLAIGVLVMFFSLAAWFGKSGTFHA